MQNLNERSKMTVKIKQKKLVHYYLTNNDRYNEVFTLDVDQTIAQLKQQYKDQLVDRFEIYKLAGYVDHRDIKDLTDAQIAKLNKKAA
jgi:hypothetical protein